MRERISQRLIRLGKTLPVLRLGAGRFADDGGCQAPLFQQSQQRQVGRAVLGIGKGQMALFAPFCVGNTGKMGMEPGGTLRPQHLEFIQQRRIIPGGCILPELGALAAGIQVAEVDAGG